MDKRKQDSFDARKKAAELAQNRSHPNHQNNRDEERYASARYFMSFTKGLPHNPETGLLQDPQDFEKFRQSIDKGFIEPFTNLVRHGAQFKVASGNGVPETDAAIIEQLRPWEAPTAGFAFDLQGPDAQAVTMPPAPALIDDSNIANPELVFEMAEVYELALIRDQPLNDLETGASNPVLQDTIDRLNHLSYLKNKRLMGRPRKVNERGKLDAQTIFRGSSPGVELGPYLSQFLLIGNVDLNGTGTVSEGEIGYGPQSIDQKVPIATPRKNYMVTMADYVAVQRGNKPELETYVVNRFANPMGQPARRFISTPRDLATYVHYDVLFQAYLNACIILLGMGTPFDPALGPLSGMVPGQIRNAGGFALYGGPHVVTLVTEVATRALKAVRFQKFNNHIRLRPEALAGKIELTRLSQQTGWRDGKAIPMELLEDVGKLCTELQLNSSSTQPSTLEAISKLTQKSGASEGNYLLPMAFPEGSPMHPSYGAGHATVAGACVTMLKAFFDTSTVLARDSNGKVRFKAQESSDQPIAFRAPRYSKLGLFQSPGLKSCQPGQALTLEGELNKLAANISIGRNMAGVHYFSDYYDSLRMGEQIAIGILEEQALTYPTDPFVLSLRTFDGLEIEIGR